MLSDFIHREIFKNYKFEASHLEFSFTSYLKTLLCVDGDK